MKKILLFAVLILAGASAGTYFLKGNPLSTDKQDTQRISMCGNTFTAERIVKEGIDIGQRIALLATEEYEQASIKEHTNCFFIKNLTPGSHLSLAVEEKISEEPNLRGKAIYLVIFHGDEYIIDRENNQVYNVNAMDGSTRNVIGNFK